MTPSKKKQQITKHISHWELYFICVLYYNSTSNEVLQIVYGDERA